VFIDNVQVSAKLDEGPPSRRYGGTPGNGWGGDSLGDARGIRHGDTRTRTLAAIIRVCAHHDIWGALRRFRIGVIDPVGLPRKIVLDLRILGIKRSEGKFPLLRAGIVPSAFTPDIAFLLVWQKNPPTSSLPPRKGISNP